MRIYVGQRERPPAADSASATHVFLCSSLHDMATTSPVLGWCPMGCGETLMLHAGDWIGCGDDACPCPDAVTQILADRESEHQVRFDPPGGGFTIRHPLRERIND